MQQLQFKSQIQYTEKETGDKTEQTAFLVLEWDGEDGLSGESCGHDDGLLQHVEQVTQDHQLAQAHVDGKLENESICHVRDIKRDIKYVRLTLQPPPP